MIFILMGFVAGCANYGAIHALRLADASLLMPAEYAKIIWMTLWGYLFFSEIPGLNVWAGALLIGAATAVITWRERQRPTTIETGKQVT